MFLSIREGVWGRVGFILKEIEIMDLHYNIHNLLDSVLWDESLGSETHGSLLLYTTYIVREVEKRLQIDARSIVRMSYFI